MAEHANRQEERQELESILASGIFARSPSLAQFLQYVCEKHFNGLASEIKEYNVAVEALGRPSDFDQKKDSIVRVEAHRLRKRLQAYYAQEGASHPLEITIPAGNYAPVFVRRGTESPDAGSYEPATPPEPPAPPAGPIVASASGKRRYIPAALAALLLLVTSLFAIVRIRDASHPPPATAASRTRMEPPAGEGLRIMAGNTAGDYIDSQGQVWTADRFYDGGTALTASPRPIVRTSDPALFRSRREGEFRYHIPLEPGSYQLRLHFAETVFGDDNDAGGGESSRIFTVRANGDVILREFDAVADAPGSNAATARVFRNIRPASDGKLHLEFVKFKDLPFVNAIELLPTVDERMRPVRMLARQKGLTDTQQRAWTGDRFVRGGQLTARRDPVSGADDPELYRYERFGNFSYSIPVAEARRYTLRLRFAEHWFGPGRTGGGGPGSRVFDVYCNGRTLLKNFDVFAEAGSLRAVDKVFRGLEPSAQGKLQIDFVPVRNYALINAIEVVDEGR